MRRLALPYAATGQFSRMVLDLLEDAPAIQPFRQHGFHTDGLQRSLAERHFPAAHRLALSEALRHQYGDLPRHEAVQANLDRLARTGTITITTGHQLSLFGGPAFVLFKVLNTVRLARDLSTEARPVVPVFWMASEDHDLAEVDHVVMRGETVRWNTTAGGPVGRMTLSGIGPALQRVETLLGPEAVHLRDLLREAYAEDRTLAEATRRLINGLFGHLGVVVLDGDDPALKALFAPVMREELLNGLIARTAAYAEQQFPEGYSAQAHVRPINLFHLAPGSRARIAPDGDELHVVEGGPRWTVDEALAELEQRPEDFSPNVLMRPLYQETVLPNVAYVGGGGELAYWMQLRWAFQAVQLPMPVTALRTSGVFLAEADADRLSGLGLSMEDVFAERHAVERRLAERDAPFATRLDREREALRALFSGVAERTAAAGPSFVRSAASAEQRALHGIGRLEQRLLRTAKHRNEVVLRRYHAVRDAVFPNGVLQERREGFLSLLADHGPQLIDELLSGLDPLEKRFSVFVVPPRSAQEA
ncbi:MAG: bacillithiol biosynthesis cysteine-adding enzyme BshC [Flavobacteriales bacterium]|nr:bacillithiol biosynthesis cysteine-adding enzyme BshC [Flavobacteriales bacterium]